MMIGAVDSLPFKGRVRVGMGLIVAVGPSAVAGERVGGGVLILQS
jgi:hypothetical protein